MSGHLCGPVLAFDGHEDGEVARGVRLQHLKLGVAAQEGLGRPFDGGLRPVEAASWLSAVRRGQGVVVAVTG